MQTVRDYIMEFYTERGLQPREAEWILKAWIADDEALGPILDTDTYRYSIWSITGWWPTLRQYGVSYINEHNPEHGARRMFAQKPGEVA